MIRVFCSYCSSVKYKQYGTARQQTFASISFASLQVEDRQNTQYSTEKRNEQIICDDELSDLMKLQANKMFRRTLSC